MKAEFESLGVTNKSFITTWNEFESLIDRLHPETFPYLILENNVGNYMQCAGAKDRLVIEVRIDYNDSFEHYVLGKKNLASPESWAQVDCKVGPINVLENEVLTIADAKVLFNQFYESGSINVNYSKRVA